MGINDIPDHILGKFLSFLPIKEAIGTSVLSRRWRYVFNFVSSLDLDMDDIQTHEEATRFLAFVDTLLTRLDSITIFKFRSHNNAFDSQRVGEWLSRVVCPTLQELDLWTDFCPKLVLPRNIFSENLVILKLRLNWDSHELQIPTNINLPHLKVVHFRGLSLPSQGSERLFPSCPRLNELLFWDCALDEHCVEFSVSNQSIKKLALTRFHLQGKGPVSILVSAPSLDSLEFEVSQDYSIVPIDVGSISEAIVSSSRKYGSKELRQMIEYTQQVKTLTINHSVLKALKEFQVPITVFEKMTCLKIRNWEYLFDPISLEYFLTSCIGLETMVFEESMLDNPLRGTSYTLSMQESRLNLLLGHLKTIEIQLLHANHIEILMPTMKCLLKHAAVLEKLKVRSWGEEHVSEEIRRWEDLMSSPRLSKKCQFEFSYT